MGLKGDLRGGQRALRGVLGGGTAPDRAQALSPVPSWGCAEASPSPPCPSALPGLALPPPQPAELPPPPRSHCRDPSGCSRGSWAACVRAGAAAQRRGAGLSFPSMGLSALGGSDPLGGGHEHLTPQILAPGMGPTRLLAAGSVPCVPPAPGDTPQPLEGEVSHGHGLAKGRGMGNKSWGGGEIMAEGAVRELERRRAAPVCPLWRGNGCLARRQRPVFIARAAPGAAGELAL